MPPSAFRVVTIALNVPGPLAVARLAEFGAVVTKVEPPGGHPLGRSVWRGRPLPACLCGAAAQEAGVFAQRPGVSCHGAGGGVSAAGG